MFRCRSRHLQDSAPAKVDMLDQGLSCRVGTVLLLLYLNQRNALSYTLFDQQIHESILATIDNTKSSILFCLTHQVLICFYHSFINFTIYSPSYGQFSIFVLLDFITISGQNSEKILQEKLTVFVDLPSVTR